jgi:hypothetical protein
VDAYIVFWGSFGSAGIRDIASISKLPEGQTPLAKFADNSCIGETKGDVFKLIDWGNLVFLRVRRKRRLVATITPFEPPTVIVPRPKLDAKSS